ncbi:MAG TPA: 3-phosphoshikimate 1-carboxyvinyltransferase [Mycobacteriales bacterium]|nr:3-phosphoshikimate 1-carboxyvinyltransferase [Mycobacteriales bacterium]
MTTDIWPAPLARQGVHATVRVPGSKSITNRSLLLAALADAPTVIIRPLESRDAQLMAAALRALGIEVEQDSDAWTVRPAPLRGPAEVDVGLAGTVMRFVLAVAGLADGNVAFDGDARSRERPLAALIDALRELGVQIDDGGRGGLPLTVVGAGGIPGGSVTMDASASSQLLSALLLASPRYDEGVRVRHIGSRRAGAPFVDLSVAMLRERGAEVEVGPDEWQVAPGRLQGGTVVVEPDMSSAAPFLVAPLVAGGTVRISDWPTHSLQAGAATPDVLAALGGHIAFDGTDLVVSGDGHVSGIDIDLADNPELACVLAAVAAVGSAPSRLRGIGHLRGHETDRLAALATELTALGATVTEHDDGLTVEPGPLRGGVFHTYDDHRLAMAGAVLGLVVPDLVVENIETAGKTYPDFARQWQALVSEEPVTEEPG